MAVLIIYTGGTIGSIRKNKSNPDAPLVPGTADELLHDLPTDKNNQITYGKIQVKIEIKSLDEPIDSSMIKPEHWVKIAEIIEEQYEPYEGFVVLHGTDTMAYTASCLAFMMEDLAKPIVISGSQVPIGETRSDALQNLVTAVAFAAHESLGHANVPEVAVCFDNKLMRGCRTTKVHADSYHGFDSPNYPLLGIAGEFLEIREDLIQAASLKPKLKVRKGIDRHIAVLKLSPLMDYSILDAILSMKDLRGVILETYGAGNAPTDPEFLSIIEKAIKNNTRIVDVTQCGAGTVQLGLYDVSTGLLERSVISGLDMTTEAAQTKLAVMLADKRSIDEPEELMQISLRGEMDNNLFDVGFDRGEANNYGTVWTQGDFPASSYFPEKPDDIVTAKLRILGLKADVPPDTELNLDLYYNSELDENERPLAKGDAIRVRGITPGRKSGEYEPVLVDLSQAVRDRLDIRTKQSLTVKSSHKIEWSDMHLAIFTKPYA